MVAEKKETQQEMQQQVQRKETPKKIQMRPIEQKYKIPMDERKHEFNFPRMRDFHIIVACDSNDGIGDGQSIPWRVPQDMAYFRRTTTKLRGKGAVPSPERRNAVIMGRHTWESIPKNFRPLNDRLNVILSSKMTEEDVYSSISEEKVQCVKENGDVLVINGGLEKALQRLAQIPYIFNIESVFCIGGANVYSQAVKLPCVRTLRSVSYTRIFVNNDACTHFFHFPPKPEQATCHHINGTSKHFCNYSNEKNSNECKVLHDETSITDDGERDTFDEFERTSASNTNLSKEKIQWMCEGSKGVQISAESGLSYEIVKFVKRNEEQQQYLNLMQKIIKEGLPKSDRTGVGTRSLFGCMMRFSLRDNRLPLLTTKRVFWRGVCKQLMWFIRGQTNANLLKQQGVNIWNDNGSREFLDKRGLTQNEQMDLGPIYGFQWRHFNAPYDRWDSDYNGKGIDQLKQIVQTIKTNPTDRRLLLTAWNPCALNKMALPPCHITAQFYVNTEQNELSCMMMQRSCDMGLGVPFNIASYSLLTILIAKATGLKPGDFVHALGDTHVYENHVVVLQEQFKRIPRQFPVLIFKNDRPYLEDYCDTDMELLDYEPYPAIAMQMAVQRKLAKL